MMLAALGPNNWPRKAYSNFFLGELELLEARGEAMAAIGASRHRDGTHDGAKALKVACGEDCCDGHILAE